VELGMLVSSTVTVIGELLRSAVGKGADKAGERAAAAACDAIKQKVQGRTANSEQSKTLPTYRARQARIQRASAGGGSTVIQVQGNGNTVR
jgi:hypothetical protein